MTQPTTPFAGKVALITGGTDGIGRAAALRLARLGAYVLIVGRSAAKGQAAITALQGEPLPESPGDSEFLPGCIEYVQADLSLMRGVQALAETIRSRFERIDVLLHCAGVMRPRRTLTAEGLETVFAVQYVARVHLTELLLDRLTPDSRIINVSAGGTLPLRLDFENLNGEKWYNGVYALMHESVANDLALLRFIRTYPALRFYAYGPFYVKTALFAEMPWWFNLMTGTFGRLMATTPDDAAEDITALVRSDRPSGMVSRNLKPIRPNAYRADTARQDRLWNVTQALIERAVTGSS
ncbi:MAG: SDR family NAD(P)-dependent oxidoreductase [Anaerolinea sp.]|nr:SDR family NAD(P)-dependent oxidoreductase [Anaerolinea sp.]